MDFPSINNGAELQELRPFLLDPRENYPEPYYLLEFNGVPFSTLGGIQAIAGQKKNGKSFVFCQLMSAILGQGSERAAKYLSGLRVPQRTLEHLGHPPKVLYVDTEMEKLNTAKVLRRVHWLCGWDEKSPNERFNALWLRSVEREDVTGVAAYKRRLELIKKAIDFFKPDAVFVDGIRDLIGDFNDIEEASSLIQILMSIAQENNLCIWNALHFNPRPGRDDESKMRGHLGTELGNKVSDTLVSVKKKESSGVIFTVRQEDARGKDIDDWRFEVCEDAGALGIPRIFASGQSLSGDIGTTKFNREEIVKWINSVDIKDFPMSGTEFKEKIFRDKGGVRNKDKQCHILAYCKENGLIKEIGEQRNGYPLFTPSEELPF